VASTRETVLPGGTDTAAAKPNGPVSATTTTRRTPIPSRRAHVTFPRVVRSEWVKLRTLRSTAWSYGLLFVLLVAFGLLIALTSAPYGDPSAPAQVGADLAVTAATLGLVSAQLVIAIQGVLLMAGEFSTGMIASSFTAVPGRLPVLWAKVLVFGGTTLVVTFAGIVATFLIAAPILRGGDYTVDVTNAETWLRLLGGAGYLTLIGVIAVGVGAVTRAPSAGIGVVLAASLVLPTFMTIFGGTWFGDLISWLPGLAGQEMFFWGASPVPSPFEPWQGFLVMCGWSTLALGAAAVTLVRRDA
jgi:ABC-2 type transport system permease protein